MSFIHDWRTDGVYIRFFDTLTSKNLIESNSKLVGKPEFEKIKYVITDFSEITGIEIDNTDVNISTLFAANSHQYNKHVKVALVVTDKTLQELAEKYIEETLKLVPDAQQKMFNNLNIANDWIAS